MKKFIILLILISGFIGFSGYAQQGPSIRLEGDLPIYGIPVGTGDRAVNDSGVTISNGTMTVANLIVTNSAQWPGPLITQNIVANTIDATNSLTLNGIGVITSNDIESVLTGTPNKIPNSVAVSNALAAVTPNIPTTVTLPWASNTINGALYSLQTNGIFLSAATNPATCYGRIGFGTGTNSLKISGTITTNCLAGGIYYIGAQDGTITEQKPNTSGYAVRQIGYGESTNTLAIDVQIGVILN